jgi:Gas vesicle protein
VSGPTRARWPEELRTAVGSTSGSRTIAPGPADATALEARTSDERRLVLSDLVNRILDRGLMITGSVTLAVADIDLVQLDLNLVLSAVETATRHKPKPAEG